MRFESAGSHPTRPHRPQLSAGQKLGSLTLVELIGRGGMGEVWKALDAVRDAHVALKFLPAEVQDSAREMRRVVQTFRAVQALQHPHICPVYFLDSFPPFGQVLGMKFIDGLTLLDYRDRTIEERGAFPVEEVIRILRPVAAALDYAHNPGVIHPEVTRPVIHRDIKPENILVSADGRSVQIVDFGLVEQVRMSVSRVSQVEMDTSGTRPYMAPEQWRGQFQDGRTDQYGLAVVAYELIADRLPFEVADPFQLRECVLNEPVEPIPGQPPHVNAALRRALSKQAVDRFPTCGELITALGADGGAAAGSIRTADAPGAEPAAPVSDSPQTAGPKHDSRTVSGSPRPDSGSRLAEHVRSMQARAAEAHQQAQQLMEEAHDYDAAAELLSGLSDELRNDELYRRAVSRRDRVHQLEAEITSAVQSMRLSGMRSRVSELLHLKPERTDLRELLETLPPEAPALLVAPFDADAAQRGQEAWAEFLGRPVEWENSIGMKFRLIPPGEFLMGSPESEAGRDSDEKQHRVRITRPFYCGIYPVTQAEYQAVMGSNPSHFNGKAGFVARLFGASADGKDMSRFPVEQVSWNDAQEFLKKLSSRPGESGVRYRLLTEAEWEYCCRAGTETAFWFGSSLNGQQANCNGNYPYPSGTSRGPYLARTSAVGSYPANGFGLYDTHGNVWEWCADWYASDYYSSSPEADPPGPPAGSSRVVRGGSFLDEPRSVRCAYRDRGAPADRFDSIGFRIVVES